ncbi:MAG TPA: hypothetical protein PLJ00_02245 [Chitinophagales bacterium]|nr:hypothetical protein [Chitinophagales bacterium]
MKKSVFLLTLTTISAVMFLSSCAKKEGCMDQAALNYDPEAEVDKGCEYASDDDVAVTLHMHQNIGGGELVEETAYTINGVVTNLNLVQFYVSAITLVDAAGNEITNDDVYLLVKPEEEAYAIGNFPAGDYTQIRFDIGIDSVTNHADPSKYDIGNPLGAQFPAMHWGWSFGYIFVRIDGEADADGNGVPDPDGQFEMHLGSDAYVATIEIDLPITIAEGNENIVHLDANWDTFFTGVDMANDNTTHVTDNAALSSLLYENIFNMFSAEE